MHNVTEQTETKNLIKVVRMIERRLRNTPTPTPDTVECATALQNAIERLG